MALVERNIALHNHIRRQIESIDPCESALQRLQERGTNSAALTVDINDQGAYDAHAVRDDTADCTDDFLAVPGDERRLLLNVLDDGLEGLCQWRNLLPILKLSDSAPLFFKGATLNFQHGLGIFEGRLADRKHSFATSRNV